MDSNSNTCIKGTCLSMCPRTEIIMREKERLVHILESYDVNSRQGGVYEGRKYKISADPKKMVKSFQRSGVGRDMQNPDDLRPPYVLKQTVTYLLGIILNVGRVQWPIVYGFISDRLRAVRQDMVIQQPSVVECIEILEPIVRFHVYASYRLCEESINVFNPKLNAMHFGECLKRLLVLYDLGDIDSHSRWEMEAIYILYNLGDNYALTRAISLQITSNTTFDIALAISLAGVRNDYFTICRLFTGLPVLHQITLALQFPAVRRTTLQTMNSAYSSKNLSYPLPHLTSLLLFNEDEETCTECRYYKLNVSDGNIYFLKGTFDCSVNLASVKKMEHIDAILKETNISQMLLGNNSDS